jgi:4-hydroxybenzoate polyprenyltransferase
VFLLFVVLTFLGESFAGSGLFMLPLVEEASLVEAFVDLFLFVIVTSTSTCPTERLYDRNSDSHGPKKAKTADGKSN